MCIRALEGKGRRAESELHERRNEKDLEKTGKRKVRRAENERGHTQQGLEKARWNLSAHIEKTKE